MGGSVAVGWGPGGPKVRRAGRSGSREAVGVDEGMRQWGLYAAALRLPFLPTRAGLGSDVMKYQPHLKTVKSPYEDGEELVAMAAGLDPGQEPEEWHGSELLQWRLRQALPALPALSWWSGRHRSRRGLRIAGISCEP